MKSINWSFVVLLHLPQSLENYGGTGQGGAYLMQYNPRGDRLWAVKFGGNLPTDATLEGGAGDDLLIGGSGNDFLNGGDGNDRLFAEGGNDTLLGSNGNDRLVGQDGNDRLFGGVGRDTILGGTSSDRLDGGTGNDVLISGVGRDRIVVRRGQGTDRLRDFRNGADRIDLVGIGFNQLTLRQSGDNVLVRLGQQTLLVLEDINLNSINNRDFV